VISLQEREGDLFDPIRERIRAKKGRIRKSGADYLAYTLIDVIVDNYFAVLEKLGAKIASIEEDLIAEPSSDTLHEIHSLRREVASMRKVVWSTRELISGLHELESPLIADSTSIFIKDAYDHIIQVIDAVETFREMLGGMIDIYLSSTSNKMNEAMKVLSIIATIFIPLSFIAGVYGMNFKNMPELEWQWGYFVAVTGMILIGLSMAVYFKIKNWF
jgi:magnesium transporter